MNRLAFLTFLVFLSGCASAGPSPDGAVGIGGPPSPETLLAHLDLTDVDDDRLPVRIVVGAIDQDEVLFRLPRVVQGTYAISDFGTYVEDLVAYDADGRALAVEQVDPNSWRISDATRLSRIEYRVNDTFDVEREREDVPFSPSGTNIEDDIFVLNLHGFVGYLEGRIDRPYEIRITAPIGMERASALRVAASDTSTTTGSYTDVYRAERYFDVTDNPMLYGDIETETFPVDDIEVTVSVYNPGEANLAAELRDAMAAMMRAQRSYLGDLETTDRYGVYLFMSDVEDADDPTGFGALEHHTSTVTVLPTVLAGDALAETMVDIISHEFFHIVTPLSVHSEDIHDFDYNDPTFSKHLWMYEGVTEYFANHFQVHEGLIDRPDFYERMARKVENAAGYDDTMSFTEMSENIVEPEYEDSFTNVYEKGALIGMCLDVLLHRESGGARSLLSLMRDLSDRYGSERPFVDDELIAEITEMTYPSVGDFLTTHVEGGVPIVYSDCLDPVGLAVEAETVTVNLFFLTPEIPFIDADPATGEIFFRNIPLNSSLTELGVQGEDVLVSINGTEYDLSNIQQLVTASVQWTAQSEIELVVERDGEEVTLTGTLGTPQVTRYSIIEETDASTADAELRDAWLTR